MKKIILIAGLLLVACSDDTGNSVKVASEKMALKCFHVINSDYALFILDFKNQGDKADVVPFSSVPEKSFTGAPVTWNPSNIIINLVYDDSSSSTTYIHYRTYTISRSTLNMEWSTYFTSKHKYKTTTERHGYPPKKHAGYCEVTEVERPKNVF